LVTSSQGKLGANARSPQRLIRAGAAHQQQSAMHPRFRKPLSPSLSVAQGLRATYPRKGLHTFLLWRKICGREEKGAETLTRIGRAEALRNRLTWRQQRPESRMHGRRLVMRSASSNETLGRTSVCPEFSLGGGHQESRQRLHPSSLGLTKRCA
jgi:hypothetical protein